MTRDAKIGLLLGLVFIFIIALVINGLPSFSGEKNNNELTTNMVGLRNNPPAIGAKERKIINPTVQVESYTSKADASASDNVNTHFEMALPKSHPVADKINEVKPTAPTPSSPAMEENRSIRNEADPLRRSASEASKTALPKVYVVTEGDSLAAIAKKFYGPQEGDKKINITRIFEANRKLLSSPDEIYAGQKLIIPPLPAAASGKDRSANTFSGSEFIEVESIGRRYLPTNTEQTKQYRLHTVREGETLWQIAADKLGNGNRYGEIVKLNADILKDEDSLFVGMSLKIPPR